MRLLTLVIGLPVAIGLTLVSMLANWRFGVRLGAEEGDALAYGLASVCADGLKVVLPFALSWAWAKRRIAEWLAGAALWIVITAYSLVSALSFAAVNRAEIADRKAQQSQSHTDIRADLDAKRAERRQIMPRPLAAIDAELQAAERDRWWAWTKQCSEPQGREARQFCDAHVKLVGEHASAQRADALDAEITALAAKLDKLPATAGAKPSDPQVELFRSITGLTEANVKASLAVLVCLLIELGSGLGLFVVTAFHRSTRGQAVASQSAMIDITPPPMIPSDDEWVRERLERNPSGIIGAAELYADYRLWLEARGRSNAMTVTAFGRWMSDLGMKREKIGGRIVYRGIRLCQMPTNYMTA